MKQFLLLLFIFFVSNLTAQNFDAKDILYFDGEYNSHEEFHIDPSGNKYLAGKGTGAIDLDFGNSENLLPETSYRDLYLAKYDEENNLMWLRSFDGTTLSNQIRAIQSDSDGNVYISGSILGRLNLTNDGQNEIENFGSSSMFVAKFDKDGILQWKFVVGDSNFSQYPDEMFISDNRLIIQFVYTGTFDVDPGAGTTTLSGNSNALLVYDLNGSFIDAHHHTGNTNVRASGIDSEGNIYLGGSFSGLVSFDYMTNASTLSSGIFDAFLTKYDKDFNLIWLKKFSKSFKSMRFSNIAIDSNDEIVATAEFAKEVVVGNFNTANDANYLLKIAGDGTINDLVEILPEDSFVFDISLDSKDQIIITANFEETIDIDLTEGVFELMPVTNKDIFLAVYDSELNLIGADQIYGPTIWTYSIHVDRSDRLHILTDFVGEAKIIFGSETLYSSTQESENFVYYTIDIGECSTTSEAIEVFGCNIVDVNDFTYAETGTFDQVLTNAEGCDSILTILCTIYPNEFVNIDTESCGPAFINGQEIETSGTYTFNLFTTVGCDSTVTIILDVIDTNPSILVDENELLAEEMDGDAYQWIDCATDERIEGATNRTFSPESDGSYRVEITKASCVTFSECIDFILVGIQELSFDFSVFPNPSRDFIKVGVEEMSRSAFTISLFNINGKEIIRPYQLPRDGLVDLQSLGKGIYFIKLENDSGALFKKIVLY